MYRRVIGGFAVFFVVGSIVVFSMSDQLVARGVQATGGAPCNATDEYMGSCAQLPGPFPTCDSRPMLPYLQPNGFPDLGFIGNQPMCLATGCKNVTYWKRLPTCEEGDPGE